MYIYTHNNGIKGKGTLHAFLPLVRHLPIRHQRQSPPLPRRQMRRHLLLAQTRHPALAIKQDRVVAAELDPRPGRHLDPLLRCQMHVVVEHQRPHVPLGAPHGPNRRRCLRNEVERPGLFARRVHDHGPVEAVLDLGPRVRVVPVAAVFGGPEAVREVPARGDRPLRHAGDAIGPGGVELFDAWKCVWLVRRGGYVLDTG